MTEADASAEDRALVTKALVGMGLGSARGTPVFTPLTGGVSSDIWRVDWDGRSYCVKRACARLRVAALWEAPVARSRYEARWLQTVGEIHVGAAPALLGHDPEAGVLAMAYLPPADHRLWKAALLEGDCDAAFGAAVGSRLGEIHARTAGRTAVAAAFDSDEIFQQIRLEPYLLATARQHPDLAEVLNALAHETGGTHKALVHGDVSPKNILMGPLGPVFLDAECAWYGDPAFDLAFCLNHLLLKSVRRPSVAHGYLTVFDQLLAGYLAWVDWEPPEALLRRVARLLPALFLARVDGKSPVEYLTAPAEQDLVRRVARTLLMATVDEPSLVRAVLRDELDKT